MIARQIFSCSFVIIGVLLFSYCGGNGSGAKKDGVDSAKKINDSVRNVPDSTAKTSATETVDKAAADFAAEAAENNMMQETLGRIAEKKAMSDRIKNLGILLAKDHSQLNADLNENASRLHIILPSVPGAETERMVQFLNKKDASDFDQAYVKFVLHNLRQTLPSYRQSYEVCTSPTIKKLAYQTLLKLAIHLDSAEAISGKQGQTP